MRQSEDLICALWELAVRRIVRMRCMSRFQFKTTPTNNLSFMYGGTTGKNTSSNAVEMSKVFILSLPSFHWIEVPERADTWRTEHTCQTIGPSSTGKHNRRQMVSIGGVMDPNPFYPTDYSDVRDTWTSGMKIFDLTKLTWGNVYDASAKPYERSQLVNDYYDDNVGYPEVWGDPALEAIFKTDRSQELTPSLTTTSSNAGPTSPGDDGSPDSGSPDSGSPDSGSPESGSQDTGSQDSGPTRSEKSTNTGAIAGGVVGGICALALLGLAVFLWRRRMAKADDGLIGGAKQVIHGPAEMPVASTEEPKAEMPAREYYRTELP